MSILAPTVGLSLAIKPQLETQPASLISKAQIRMAQKAKAAHQKAIAYKATLSALSTLLVTATIVRSYTLANANQHATTLLNEITTLQNDRNGLQAELASLNSQNSSISSSSTHTVSTMERDLVEAKRAHAEILVEQDALRQEISKFSSYLEYIKQMSAQLDESRKPLIDLTDMLTIVTNPQTYVKPRSSSTGDIPVFRQISEVLNGILDQEHMGKYAELKDEVKEGNYTEMQLKLSMYISAALGQSTTILTHDTSESSPARKMREDHNNFGVHSSENPFIAAICDPIGSIFSIIPSLLIAFTQLHKALEKSQGRIKALEEGLDASHTAHRKAKTFNGDIPEVHPLLQKSTQSRPSTPIPPQTPRSGGLGSFLDRMTNNITDTDAAGRSRRSSTNPSPIQVGS